MAKRKAAKPKKAVKKAGKTKARQPAIGDLVLVTTTLNASRNQVARVTALSATRACVDYALDENQKEIGSAQEWIVFKNIRIIVFKS